MITMIVIIVLPKTNPTKGAITIITINTTANNKSRPNIADSYRLTIY